MFCDRPEPKPDPLAPYLPYVTEEVWQASFANSEVSIHKAEFPSLQEVSTVKKINLNQEGIVDVDLIRDFLWSFFLLQHYFSSLQQIILKALFLLMISLAS